MKKIILILLLLLFAITPAYAKFTVQIKGLDNIGAGNSIAEINDADKDTKIEVERTSDDDTIRFSTAGSDRMTVSSTGNVGIGTTTPSRVLDVKGVSSIDGVIIGTNIVANADDQNITLINNPTDTGDDIYINAESVDEHDPTTGGDIYITAGTAYSQSGTGTGGSVYITGGDGESTQGNVVLSSTYGRVGIGTTSPITCKLDVNGNIRADDAIRAKDASGISLQSDDGIDRLTVADSGRVGIGTTNPTEKLTVNGNVSATSYYGDGSNLTGIDGSDSDWTINGTDTYTTLGNVGIGTSSPSEALDVSGNIKASGNCTADKFYGDGSNLTNLPSGFSDPMTTRGDIIYRNSSNETDRLGLGSNGQYLSSDGTDLVWSTPSGTGDVTSASNITDNALVRGDGGAKGIQETGLTVNDSDDLSCPSKVSLTGSGKGLYANANSVVFTLQTATGDGTTTIDWQKGNKFKFTHGAMDETFTFTAPQGACNLLLIVVQDSTGGRSVTFPSTVKWVGGTQPDESTGANDVDMYTFFYDGTNYYGAMLADFS